MPKWKVRIANWLFKHLFNGITENDVLKQLPDGNFVYNKTVFGQKEKLEIADEANSIINMPVYQMLKNEMTQIANKRIYQESKTIEDTIAGKMLLYYIDVLDTKLRKLSSLK